MKLRFSFFIPLVALLLAFANRSFAQRVKADSLLQIYQAAKGDTNKLNALLDLGWEVSFEHIDSALVLGNEAIALAEKLPVATDPQRKLKTRKLARATYNMGSYEYVKHEYHVAFSFLSKALDLTENTGKTELRCNVLTDLGLTYWHLNDYSKSLNYQNLAFEMAEALGNKKASTRISGNIGILYAEQGNYTKAFDYYSKALALYEELKDKQGTARMYCNIGIVYWNKGDYLKALDYDFKALNLTDSLKNKPLLAKTLNNTGLVYMSQSNYRQALGYMYRSLALEQELKNKYRIASELSNIATIYTFLDEYPKALNYTHWAMNICTELDDKNGLSFSYGALGDISGKQGDSAWAKGNFDLGLKTKYPDALRYYSIALKLATELGNINSASTWLGNKGRINIRQANYVEAEHNLLRALALADSISALNSQRFIHENLSELYVKKGDYKKAYLEHLAYSSAKDTLFNKDRSVEISRKEMNYEYDKKSALRQAEQEKKDAISAGQRQRQRIVLYAICGILLLVISLALLIYRGSLQRKKANLLLEQKNGTIERQKVQVEEKNRNITESINYAKRIQEAVLPAKLFEPGEVADYFVYEAPKDIVSGDFYWRFKEGDTLFFAVVDCTGHGVPGAMMSMLGYEMLEYAVKDKGLREPSQILDALNDRMMEKLLKNNDKETSDGMDLTLCKLDLSTRVLTYSGARNELYVTNDGVLSRHAVDRCSIGDQAGFRFSQHTIILKPNTGVYLFTDGYADQKGGPEQKKYLTRRFQELLQDISDFSGADQKNAVNHEFLTWKNKETQRDDVLVVGFKI
jgi:serine phosphatase RsbU (regulator of sigma subunit)